MSRRFHPSTNALARAILVGIPVVLVAGGYAAWEMQKSSFGTEQGIVREQPVPFSHKHHVGELGLDCRYCHTSVADSSYAGMPPTKTCMTCHSQIWTNAAVLQPIRDSWNTGKPVSWQRVHNLPRYVYFDHSIHVAKGVGCSTCHGQIDAMPLTSQAAPLTMSWCLHCHKNPADYLRPRNEVFNMSYSYPANQAELGQQLAKEYEVRPTRDLIDCGTCHR